MPVPVKPAASSARRMAPMRPSIMSDGATRSTPARACSTAIWQRMPTVRSLSTSLPSGVSTPSWPCVVYGSSAMSVMTAIPGTAFFTARTARSTSASSSRAMDPSGSLNFGSIEGKRATAGTPSLCRARHSFTRSARLRRKTPGIDRTASGPPWPSTTNSGAMKSWGRNTVSSVRARRLAVRRRRRGRWVRSSLKFSGIDTLG